MSKASKRDLRHIEKIHLQMGIPRDYMSSRNLPAYSEAENLVKLENDIDDRSFYLTSDVAKAWSEMKVAAANENIILKAYSGFRNYEYQRRIIEKRIQNGESLASILNSLAAPGFSEHHTGCAIDITTENCRAGVEEFEDTEAYSWLSLNAIKYRFKLSFPRKNQYGFIYEPWHWCYN